MANENTISMSLAFEKGSFSASLRKQGLQVTVTGTKFHHSVQNVGTSEEQMDFGDISTPGWCFLINRDGTNYVELRPATGVADLIRMNAGEPALFRFAQDCTAPFMIANTAACNVEMLLIEN